MVWAAMLKLRQYYLSRANVTYYFYDDGFVLSVLPFVSSNRSFPLPNKIHTRK